MTKKEVPFFGNTSDDTHCYQAALKMILKYFFKHEDYSWDELDSITQKEDGMWTWPMAGVLWLKSRGMDIKVYEQFDYNAFSRFGLDYIKAEYGEEVAKAQGENSNIPKEKIMAQKYLEEIDISKSSPNIETINLLLSQNYLVCCNVNSKALTGDIGYVGHFVVITGYDSDILYYHDPGLPHKENQQIEAGLFEKAWAYPNDKAKNIIAVKINE